MRIRHLPRLCQTFTDNVGRRRRAVCHRLYTRYTATLTIGTDTNCLLPQRMKARGVPNTSIQPRFATAVTNVSGQGIAMVYHQIFKIAPPGSGFSSRHEKAALNIFRCFRAAFRHKPTPKFGQQLLSGKACECTLPLFIEQRKRHSSLPILFKRAEGGHRKTRLFEGGGHYDAARGCEQISILCLSAMGDCISQAPPRADQPFPILVVEGV